MAIAATTSFSVFAPSAEAQQRQPPAVNTAEGASSAEPVEQRAVPRPADPERTPAEPQRRAVPRSGEPPPRAAEQRGRQATPRRTPPQRNSVARRYFGPPRVYYFPPIDVRAGFFYHPYFGFYYGPYYGPYYPYPGPVIRPSRYSASAMRTRVRPVETAVYVNGYYAGIADDFDGVFQRLYLPAGEHRIELQLDGYRSFTRDVYIGPGDTFELDHRMELLRDGDTDGGPPGPRPLPEEWARATADGVGEQPSSPYGILAIRTDPSDAQIVIDGEAWATVAGQEEFVIHLPAGWHELDVRRDGYQNFSTRLELAEGQTTRLNVKLVE
jgi:hypothetical protein